MPRPTIAEGSQLLIDELARRYPCGRPVDLVWVPQLRYYDKNRKRWEQYWGDTSRTGRRIRIRLSRKKCVRRRETWDTILHEWAHAMEWKTAAWERHPEIVDGDRDHEPTFYVQYGILYEWFFHEGGGAQLGLL